MPLKLCAVCQTVIEGPLVVRQEQLHHVELEGFLEASSYCYICRTIIKSPQWKEVERRAKLCEQIPPAVWYLAPHMLHVGVDGRSLTWYKLTIDHAWHEDEISPPSIASSDDLPDLFPETPIWEFRLSSSQELQSNIEDQYVPTSLHDPHLLDLPRKWYSDCLENHKLCKPPNPTFRPTRLLEIIDEVETRLVITSEHEMEDSYVSFSHCWGKAKTLKLLQSNISQLITSIAVSELPTSYKEAILVCRSMNFRYIWIDSLCIIQDSREDWQQEALSMKDVYQNSALNLCACAAAENSEASFGSRDLSLITPLKVVPEWADGKGHYISKSDMHEEEVSYSPLQSRAWVVQEYFLSHRSLSLTHSQMWWQCRQKIACEAFPDGYPAGSIDPTRLKIMQEGVERNVTTGKQLQHDYEWYKLVEDYSRCGLTVATDKLIAFAGLAQALRRFYPEEQYVAGMWRSQLPLALCWSTDTLTATYRPREYIAPSWSWASIKGGITIPLIQDEFCYDGQNMSTPQQVHCMVLDVQLELADPRYDTGQLDDAEMKLQCHLIGPVDWKSRESDIFEIVSGPDSSVEYEIAMGDARIVFDNTNRDEINNASWWERRKREATAGVDQDEAARRWEGDLSEYLIPVADFDDEHGALHTFGISVYRLDNQSPTRYVRSGNFERLIFPKGILERFPQEAITIE